MQYMYVWPVRKCTMSRLTFSFAVSLKDILFQRLRGVSKVGVLAASEVQEEAFVEESSWFSSSLSRRRHAHLITFLTACNSSVTMGLEGVGPRYTVYRTSSTFRYTFQYANTLHNRNPHCIFNVPPDPPPPPRKHGVL